MDELLIIFNVIASVVIIPVTNWLKMKLPDMSFIPPIVALGLAGICAFAINKVLGANLNTRDLLMIIFSVQFVSQLGYEVTKKKNGGQSGVGEGKTE